ncbi:MAG: hypothetical protein HY554_18725 [Elusimicrobia bacterium]|nr:hypothetical protein [Elusimicrobiota bacterium]
MSRALRAGSGLGSRAQAEPSDRHRSPSEPVPIVAALLCAASGPAGAGLIAELAGR